MRFWEPSDELTTIADPSLPDAARAMVKNIAEIEPVAPSRIEDGRRNYTLRFTNGGRLIIRCSLQDDEPVDFEHADVKFERLGDEIFVSAA